MPLFDVYPLYDVEPAKARGVYVYDQKGNKYLDLYGGHAVISIGHGHRTYKRMLKKQLNRIGFYSNAVQNPLQEKLSWQLDLLNLGQQYLERFHDTVHTSLEMNYLEMLREACQLNHLK